MYQPPHFREDRLAVQHGLIRARPLGPLVTAGRAGLAANPLPFVLDAASPLGTLKAHLARANDQWRDLDPDREALVVFQAPRPPSPVLVRDQARDRFTHCRHQTVSIGTFTERLAA